MAGLLLALLALTACGPVPEAGPQGLDLLELLPPETRMADLGLAAVKTKHWSLAEGLPREWHPGPQGVTAERGPDGVRLSAAEPPWLEIRTGIDLQSLQQEPYIINEITVLAPQVFVEINKDNKTNLNELKKNLSAGISAKSGSKAETPPAESSAKEPRLIIRRITFADGTIQARAAALDNKEYQLKLPGLDMTNLGGTSGATASELASEILSRLTDRASALVKEKIIDAELDKLKAKANARIDEEKAKLQQMTDEQKQEQIDKAKDKLNNLFNR